MLGESVDKLLSFGPYDINKAIGISAFGYAMLAGIPALNFASRGINKIAENIGIHEKK